MAQLSLISGVSSARLEPVTRRLGEETTRSARSTHRGEDVAEISAGAREAARAESAPAAASAGQAPFRAELVRQVRQQIEAGTYLTPEKLEAAADRVARDLDVTA